MDRTLYIDSYQLYRDKLSYLIERRIYKVFRHLADIAFQQCKNTNTIDKHVAQFQNALSFITKWMPSEVEQELSIFIKESGLDDFQDCISCLYVLQTRMLVDVKPGMQRHSITLDIMDAAPFLHSIYVTCARVIWKQALLFGCTFPETVTKLYQQKIHELLLTTVKQTIDEIIPVSKIQRALLETYEDVREEVTTEMEPSTTAATPMFQQPLLQSQQQPQSFAPFPSPPQTMMYTPPIFTSPVLATMNQASPAASSSSSFMPPPSFFTGI